MSWLWSSTPDKDIIERLTRLEEKITSLHDKLDLLFSRSSSYDLNMLGSITEFQPFTQESDSEEDSSDECDDAGSSDESSEVEDTETGTSSEEESESGSEDCNASPMAIRPHSFVIKCNGEETADENICRIEDS